MFTDEEFADVVNTLQRRHKWYIENLPDPDTRFRGICAELGISHENIINLVDYIIHSNTRRDPVSVLELDPLVARAACHGIWAGIMVGMKIAELTKVEGTNT